MPVQLGIESSCGCDRNSMCLLLWLFTELYDIRSERQFLEHVFNGACFLLPLGNAPMTTAVDIYSFGICALEVSVISILLRLRHSTGEQ